jgi:hypothetical protein
LETFDYCDDVVVANVSHDAISCTRCTNKKAHILYQLTGNYSAATVYGKNKFRNLVQPKINLVLFTARKDSNYKKIPVLVIFAG